MFGIGWTELIVIALVVLVFVGPKNLPPLLRKVGGIMSELKSASRELRNQLDAEVRDLDISPKDMVREIEDDVRKAAEDPYEEARRADREIRDSLRSADGQIKGELRQDGSGKGAKPEAPKSEAEEPKREGDR